MPTSSCSPFVAGGQVVNSLLWQSFSASMVCFSTEPTAEASGIVSQTASPSHEVASQRARVKVAVPL